MVRRRVLAVCAGVALGLGLLTVACGHGHDAHGPEQALPVPVRQGDSLWMLGQWPLPYPVFRYATADLDGDGRSEMLVGVVKATRYDTVPRRRLFVFHMVGDKVRPLWLGSRLGGRLEDFGCRDGRIVAWERQGGGRHAVTVYGWADFGPRFERCVVSGADSTVACSMFKEYTDKHN